MALNLQNVASRVVVLKFQEELEKRRQQAAAQPTTRVLGREVPTSKLPSWTQGGGGVSLPNPLPLAQQAVGGIGDILNKIAPHRPYSATPNFDLAQTPLGQTLTQPYMNAPVRPQYGLTGGPQMLAQAAQGAQAKGLAPYQAMTQTALPESVTSTPYIGRPLGLAATPAIWPFGLEAGAQMVGGRLVLGAVGRKLWGEKGEEILGTVGEIAGLASPAAYGKAKSLAELALPEAKAAAERLYPVGREALVGARGEAGFLKLPGKKVAEVPAEPRAYVGSLRPFEEVQVEVVTTDNPVIRAALAKTGINPSIAETTPVGKAVVAASRQEIAAEELTKVAMSSLDSRAQRFTGRTTNFNVDDVGQVRNVATREGQSRAWNDVFSHPDDYNLSRAQRDEIDVFTSVRREADQLRIEAGLKPLGVEAEGTIYVPRQVKSIGGVELRRPSNPKYERIWESAQDAIDNAVKYDNPRGTLEIYVRSAYKDVIQKQLADALEPLSITPSQLVRPQIRTRLEEAIATRQATERLARQGDAVAKAKLPAVKAEYNIAKKAYGRAMEAARHKEVTSGSFWGKSQSETIPVTMWHNRYFVREDAEKLLQNYGGLQATPRKAGMIGRGFEQTGNIIRFGASVGDFATPFVQNLPLLFRVPVRWAYTAMKHYQAFFDPTVQSRYIANHLETFQKMARNGVPIGDPEFFKAMEMGQMPSVGKPLEAIPKVGKAARQAARAVGKQTFGRFQSSYNVNLGIGRSQLWEAMEKGWTEGEAELATYIRNMTGGLDTRALGVGPEQRALESTWAAFSPRLLRSTVSLVGDALKTPPKLAVGMTPKQRELESARTMLQLAAGVAGIYVLVGKGLGKSNEEIARGLNPLGGKRFLSYQINGDWIGVGGQVRALVQLAGGLVAGGADAIKDISEGKRVTTSLTSPSIYDNPLLAFYGSRGAMGLKISGGLVEAATNGKLDTLPYENVDTPAKLARNLALAALPFTLQGALQGEKPLTSALAMVGARTQAEARGEQRERISLEETGTAYSKMKPQQKKDFTAAHPELFAGADEYPESAPQHHLIDIAETKATRMDALGKQLDAGEIDGQEYIDGRSTILTEAAIASAEYATGYEPDNPYDQAFGEWQQIIAEAKAANPAGVLTGTAFGELERQAERDMGPEKWAMVEEKRMASADPVEKRYLQDRAKMEPYWELTDKLWQSFTKGSQGTYDQYRQKVVERLRTRGMGEAYIDKDPLIVAFGDFTGDIRSNFLLGSPEVDALLVVWGYNEIVHSIPAAAIYKKRTGLMPRLPADMQ